MEPLEVLRDMLRDGGHPHIGGAPQLVKIYRHLNCLPIAVAWPDKNSGKVTELGRPYLDYEIPRWPVLDPDTLKTYEFVNQSEQVLFRP